MTELEKWTKLAETMAQQMGEQMQAFAKATGFPLVDPNVYVGTRRAGWYPEKPKRRKRVSLR